MDIKEKAQEYAKDKIQQILNDAIAEAYIEGYKQGYEDGKAEVPIKHENDEMEFVDLDLPSGTLWAKDYLKENGKIVYLPYHEAKNYKLPTKEQLEELYACCARRDQMYQESFEGICFIGTKGNSLNLKVRNYILGDERYFPESCRFWLHDNQSEGRERLSAIISRGGHRTQRSFMGYKFPILLVK